MSCQVFRNNDGQITRVEAPNGNESILFDSVLKLSEVNGDKEKALRMWAQVYTPAFKARFGDWEVIDVFEKQTKKSNISKMIDDNGEPLIQYLYSNDNINYNLAGTNSATDSLTNKAENKYNFKNNESEHSLTEARYVAETINTDPEMSGLHAEVKSISKNGEIVHRVVTKSNIEFAEELNMGETIEDQKEAISKMLDNVIDKFEGMKYVWIKPSDLVQSEHAYNVKDINSFVKNGVIYLVEGRVTANMALEELLHPFVEALFRDNKSVFRGLFIEATKAFPDLVERLSKVYKNKDDFEKEVVTRTLQQAYKLELDELDGKEYNQIKYLLNRFYDWLKALVQRIFGIDLDLGKLSAYKLSRNINIGTLAKALANDYKSIQTVFTATAAYNVSENADENLTFSSRARNVERMQKQIDQINLLISEAEEGEEGKVKVLETLRDKFQDQLQLLIDGKRTISVSNLVGGGALDLLTSTLKYQNFGNFLHNVTQSLQEEFLNNDNIIPSQLVDEDFIDKMLKAELANPISQRFTVETGEEGDIKGLNKKELVSIVKDILRQYDTYIINGYTLLPELTVIGEDKTKRSIIGRIDTLAISKDGKIEIIDLKTKKMAESPDRRKINEQLEKRNKVESSNDSASEFFMSNSDAMRSAYESWDIQLGVYEAIFKQMGLDVDKKKIVALLYMGKTEYTSTDTGDRAYDFTYKNYMVFPHESNEKTYGNVSDKTRFNYFKDKVRKVVPYEEKTEEELADTTNIIFNLSKDQEAALLKRINDTVDIELNKIKSTIAKYRKEVDEDSEVMKSLKERRESLMKIKDIMAKDSWETAYKLSIMLSFLDESYNSLINVVDEIKKEPDAQKKAQYLDALRRRASGLNYFVNELKKMLLSVDPIKNKEAIDTVGRMQTNIENITIAYNELGADFMIDVLKNMEGRRRNENITEQRRQAIEPRIKMLKERLERLKNGTPGLKDRLAKIKMWAAGSLKNAVNTSIKGLPAESLDQIKNIELQIKKLELELKGVAMDDASLKKYIEGVLENEKSLLYLGQGVSMVTDVIASASNAEFGISAFTNFLKNVQQDAQKEYNNFVEKVKFQQNLDKFAKGETDMTKLSQRITEVRDVRELDEEGNPTTTQVYSFIDPILEEYRNVFKEHRDKLADYATKIREANKNNDLEEMKKLRKEKSKLMEEHRKWKIEHCQMPLVDDIYKLENLLPTEYREKRTELLDEKESLLISVGYNNEELLSPEIIERIAEIETELQRLKMETIQKNSSYQEYIDQIDKYYEYDTNMNFFNRLMNSKKIQYGESHPMFQKWMKENTIKIPNEAFYERRSEIIEEIMSILGGSDDEIQELKERQRFLLRNVKRRGYADVRFLSKDEKIEYLEIDELIKELLASKPKAELDEDQSERLRELRVELGSISSKTVNPFYAESYAKAREALDQKYNKYKEEEERLSENPDDAQLKRNLSLALNDFLYEEEIFEAWYNENHENEYESIRTSDRPLNPIPLAFNILSLPVQDKYFDIKPIAKYTIRKLKDKPGGEGKLATNPDYQEDVYGYPLPKGMKMVNDVVEITNPSGKYVNRKYVDLSRNKDDFDFYKFITSDFISQQRKTYGKSLGYYVPGYEAQNVENVKEKGFVKGTVDNIAMWGEKNFTMSESFTYNESDMGDANIDRVRFKHNKPLPIDVQTKNAIGAVLKWHEQAFINKNVGKVQPLANSAISYLESVYKQLDESNVPDKEVRKQELQSTINILKAEYNKIIKGEGKLNQGAAAKMADTLLRGLSITRMGFDLVNQAGNLFSGNVQIFLGGHKTGQYNNKNLIWAKGKLWGGGNSVMASLTADLNKISGKSFNTKMYLHFNPSQAMLSETIDKTLDRSSRVGESLLDLSASLWLQDKGEMEIASTIWLAIMDNRRVEFTKDDGTKEMVPVWEAYGENADGEIVIKQGYNWTKADETELMRNMYSEIRRTQGNYAQIDKTKVEMNIWWRIAFFFRKYLAPAIINRFGPRRDDHEGSQVSMGYYNALIRSFQYYGFKKTIKSFFKKGEIEDFYSQRVQWAGREMLVSLALLLIGNMLAELAKGIGKDCKNGECDVSDVLILDMIGVYLKVDRETRSLNPVPGVGGVEDYINNLSSFTNAGSDINRLGRLVKHGFCLGASQIFDYEPLEKGAYYQRKAGKWEEGDPKLYKDLNDITGWENINSLYDPIALSTKLTEGFKRR